MSKNSTLTTQVGKSKKSNVRQSTHDGPKFLGLDNGNGANCCYANSVVQMLLALEPLYIALKSLDDSATNNVAKELLNLFELKRDPSYTGWLYTAITINLL